MAVRIMLRSDTIISISGLAHCYDLNADYALKGIDLDIVRGSCLGLLGPNGAGKSTLINILNGVIPLQQGEIRLNGDSAKVTQKQLRRTSSIAPQELAFYPRLTVQENLSFFGGAFGLSGASYRAQEDQAVSACKLASLMKRPAGRISGGEKRRLNLAIALLNDPDVLFLDEPTVGIDSQSRRTILDAIIDINRDGKTIVYTSHYMEEVETICDHVAIIADGRIVLNSPISRLIHQSETPRARISVTSPIDETHQQLLSGMQMEMLTPRELSIVVTNSADLSSILAKLHQIGLTIDRVSYGNGKLDDVYHDAIRWAESTQC